MKKILSIAFLFMIIFTLSACGQEDQYIDGTFTGYSEPWKIGEMEVGYEQADVTFKNNEIVDIELKRIWTDGEEVDYDMFDGTHSSGRPNLKQYRIDLANDMLEENDPTDVDTIAGATYSANGWIEAVENAIEKAEK